MHLPFLLLLLVADVPSPAIHVDQVGYPADAPKVAAVVTATPTKSFTVHRLAGGAEVLRGEFSLPRVDSQSGDRVQDADFSKLTTSGRYELRADGVGRSWPFEVAADPYGRLLRLATRSYYGQRCGTAVDLGPEFPGYAHPVCHTKEAFHASSGRSGTRPQSHGWHDAGDYGRYVVNSGISTGTLLWAWELFPEAFSRLDLSIPESANGTPDLLDEIRWNLDWMLSMQDEDGGVWHKQTSERFPPFIQPQDDRSISYVMGTGARPYKSSCATADFAAVMAIAARVYRPFDPAFAERSLHASKHAWAWLKVYPNVVFVNPRGVATGGYDDRNCDDERLWAAAELWRTAQLADAHAYFLAHARQAALAIDAAAPPSWKSVGALAAWTYVLGGNGDARVLRTLRDRSLAAAEAIVERAERHPYRIPLTRADYVWGSNAVAANYALQLLIANEIKPERRYVESALDVLHYLLGRNTFSLSWVTGLGSNAVLHPHHRPSGSDGVAAPWPGLLAGGPNGDRQDPPLRRLPKNIPPARAYVDDEESYSGNEVAINWNAALVFVTAGVAHHLQVHYRSIGLSEGCGRAHPEGPRLGRGCAPSTSPRLTGGASRTGLSRGRTAGPHTRSSLPGTDSRDTAHAPRGPSNG